MCSSAPGALLESGFGRAAATAPSSREVEPVPRTSSPSPPSHLLGNGPWDGSTDLALGWTAGREEQQSSGSATTSHEGPWHLWDITIPVGIISHHELQGWIKLLKPWGVFSSPGSCNSCARLLMNQALLCSARHRSGSYNTTGTASLLESPPEPGSVGLMAEVTLGWVGEGLWVCFRSCPDRQKLCAVRKKKNKKTKPAVKK